MKATICYQGTVINLQHVCHLDFNWKRNADNFEVPTMLRILFNNTKIASLQCDQDNTDGDFAKIMIYVMKYKTVELMSDQLINLMEYHEEAIKFWERTYVMPYITAQS